MPRYVNVYGNSVSDENGGSSASGSTASSNAFEPSQLSGTSSEKAKIQKTPQTNIPILNNPAESSDIIDKMLKPDAISANDNDMKKLRRTLNIYDSPNKTATWIWDRLTEYYNRFKITTLDDAFTKGFGHVFFVKPSCNMNGGGDGSMKLTTSNPLFRDAKTISPTIIKELSYTGDNTDSSFMLSLSNKVTGFSVNDEFINEGTAGKTYTGTQIAYGKDITESKSVNNLSITFKDDKYLHVYQLHKLWLEYISGVFRGTIIPAKNTITEKILDYAGAVYYIITAADGETIVYWEKYYGLFPTNISTDALNWDIEKPISNPSFTITYKYSFKSTYDPILIEEFNRNSGTAISKSYVPIFDKQLGHVGQSWVGIPYIEPEVGVTANENTKVYKLRFSNKSLSVY